MSLCVAQTCFVNSLKERAFRRALYISLDLNNGGAGSLL